MAGMGNTRHLASGSDRPAPPAKDVLRVYGMKFCPYVHRLKLVLAAKGVKHETVNIDLGNKPEWYFDINPRGKVPSLEKNGEVLYESDITSNYVDEVYDGRKLITKDPLKRANELIILGYFGDAVSGYYGMLRAAGDDTKKGESLKKINENVEKLVKYLTKGNKSFVCGDRPGMTDFMIWPHLERMSILSDFIKDQPILLAYCERMNKEEAVIACRHSNELHLQFIESYRSGKTTYDIGTVEEYPVPSKH